MSENGFVAQVKFVRRPDGRFHINSPGIPGLHLAGRDLDRIRADLEPIVKDLLFHNHNIVVDQLSWVPSLDDTFKKAKAGQLAPLPTPKPGEPSFLVIVGHAA